MHNMHKLNKKRLTYLAICTAVFLFCITFTSPYRLPLALIMLPGIAFIMAFYLLISLISDLLDAPKHLAKKVTVLLTVILSVVGVLLSLGQLTAKDFVLLMTLSLIGVFYVSRMWNDKK